MSHIACSHRGRSFGCTCELTMRIGGLTPIGREVGLVGEQEWQRFLNLEADREKVSRFVQEHRPVAGEAHSSRLQQALDESAPNRPTLLQLLKRPQVRIDDMLDLIRRQTQVNLRLPEWKSIETEIKYEGYLKTTREAHPAVAASRGSQDSGWVCFRWDPRSFYGSR